ncbi:MAG: hypothetical protein ACHQ01_04645 [Candidatus Limnocylindrales bacterium]
MEPSPPGPVIQTSASDWVLAVLGGASSAFPVFGGPVAAGFAEYRQHALMNRLNAVLTDLQDRIRVLGDHLDRDYVTSDSFALRFEATVDAAALAKNAGKRRYYVAALANAATIEHPNETQIDLMLRVLDQLEPIHLRLLAIVASDPEPPQVHGRYFASNSPSWARIAVAAPGVAPDVLRHCWEELAAVGLLDSMFIVAGSGTPEPNQPGPVTPFGRRFIDFVEDSD